MTNRTALWPGRQEMMRMPGRPKLIRGRGFTLVEVLVVLGIMVVLFALLFVPLTSSLQQATTGRRMAERQERLRMAVAQIQNDLREAMYVHPPELLRDPNTGMYTVNYSTLALVLPERDATGTVLQPLRPVRDSRGILVTRYAVHTPDVTIRLWPGGSPGNPGETKYVQVSAGPSAEAGFALYRQQGYIIADPDLGMEVFGSWADVTGDDVEEFVIDRPVAENAVTPTTQADIVVSRTYCRDNGQVVDGWVQVNLGDPNDPTDDTLDVLPDDSWTPQLVYLFDGVQFAPERVADEQLQASADRTVYRATYGSWRGLVNDGTLSLGELVWGRGVRINSSELAPRLRVMRWDGGGFNHVVLDTDALDPSQPMPGPDENNMLGLRWDSHAGAVLVGNTGVSTVDFDVSADPGGGFWGVSAPAEILAQYPGSPIEVGDPRAPIGYVLDPWAGDSPQASERDIRIVPDSVRVWLVAVYAANGQVARTEYAPTSTLEPDNIGLYQFSPISFDGDRRAELRFNPYRPPSPDLFGPVGTLSQFRLEIQYTTRRNFDPDSGRDDLILASYSTAESCGVRLAVSELSPYQPVTEGSAVQRPFRESRPVLYTAQFNLRNLGR